MQTRTEMSPIRPIDDANPELKGLLAQLVHNKVSDIRNGAFKDEPSMKELCANFSAEASANELTSERMEAIFQALDLESNKIQQEKQKTKEQQSIKHLRIQIQAMRQLLRERYPEGAAKLQQEDIQSIGINKLKKIKTTLAQRLVNFLSDECRVFLNDIVSIDENYAQSADAQFTQAYAASSEEKLIKVRDELAAKHKELHSILSNECNQLNREVNIDSSLVFADYATKIESSSLKSLAQFKNELTIAKSQKEEARQKIRQECLTLVRQIKEAYLDNPQKLMLYGRIENYLRTDLSLENLQAQKQQLTTQFEESQTIIREQQYQQLELQLAKQQFNPYLDKIKTQLPGGFEGEAYCETVRAQLKRATPAETKNIFAAVKKYFSEKERSSDEHIDACLRLITNIRAKAPQSNLLAADKDILMREVPPLYKLQEMKKDLTLKLDCAQLIATMRREAPKDVHLQNYLSKELEKLDSSMSNAQLDLMLKSLTLVKNDPATGIIKKIIQDFRDDSGCFAFFSIGKSAKADRIETALFNVPVHQRAKILTGNGAALAVRQELARHRYFFEGGDVYTDDKNEVIAKQAAKSFTFFSDEMQKETAKTAAPNRSVKSAARR